MPILIADVKHDNVSRILISFLKKQMTIELFKNVSKILISLWSYDLQNSFIFAQKSEWKYRTRAIISRGLYFFYPIFHCGWYSDIVERLILQSG